MLKIDLLVSKGKHVSLQPVCIRTYKNDNMFKKEDTLKFSSTHG